MEEGEHAAGFACGHAGLADTRSAALTRRAFCLLNSEAILVVQNSSNYKHFIAFIQDVCACGVCCMHMVSCCFFLMSVGAVYLWLYAHMYLCISIFICHSVSALLSLFPFKCRSCIYFLCTDEFPVLYTKEKRSVGRACILFMSLSRKCFTIERYE